MKTWKKRKNLQKHNDASSTGRDFYGRYCFSTVQLSSMTCHIFKSQNIVLWFWTLVFSKLFLKKLYYPAEMTFMIKVYPAYHIKFDAMTVPLGVMITVPKWQSQINSLLHWIQNMHYKTPQNYFRLLKLYMTLLRQDLCNLCLHSAGIDVGLFKVSYEGEQCNAKGSSISVWKELYDCQAAAWKEKGG